MDIWGDFHTHTQFSHGTGTVRDNVRAAHEKGLEAVAITDHGPSNWWGIGIKDMGALDCVEESIEECRAIYPDVRVLKGIEANIVSFKGDLDIPLSKQKELDLVLAGFHRMVKPADWLEGVSYLKNILGAKFSARARRNARNENTKMLIDAVYGNHIDIITHPGRDMDINIQELARACIKTDTILEINSSHTDLDMESIKAAVREGVDFVVNSDAHTPERVGDVEYGLSVVQKAKIPQERVINLKPRRERGKWRKTDSLL